MFKIVIKSFLKLYPYSLDCKIKRYKNILYTHWLKDEFFSVGSNTMFERGLRLIGTKNVSIENNCTIRRFSNISTWSFFNNKYFQPHISIGDNCSFGEYLNISACNSIIIKDNVLIGRYVTIIDHNHGTLNDLNIMPMERNLISKGGIVIDDDVWISDKVTICANVHIGRGSVVGANSVVTKDIPDYSVVAGCPAKTIGL